MITHSLLLNFQPNLVYLCIVFVFLNLLTLHLSRSNIFLPLILFICPLIDPFILTSFGFLLPTSPIKPPLLFLYFPSLVFRSSLSLLPSPCPLRSPPPFFPSSLSFTQCSVPRSLWLGCSSVAESLCALRCLQSIPSTRAHNQVLPLSS